ncbi:MAG: NAD(P)/FAD-dependent oxidoreductase [Planctomycetota bacterium]
MSEPILEVVVIGAGPAGSLAARGLGLLGHSVLLVDKQNHPRPKVCGCCLNRYAITTLEQHSLGGLVERLGGRPLHRLNMIAAGRSAHVPLPRGVSLSRGALDSALIVSAQEVGVEFRDGVSAKVKSLGRDVDEGHAIQLGNGDAVRARCVVVADGLGGSSLSSVPGFAVETQTASRVGLGGVTAEPVERHRIPSGTIEMACGQAGYLGVVELEDGRLDFAAAIDPSAIKAAGGLPAAASLLMEQAGLNRDDWPVDRVERWRATPALTRRRTRLAGPGVFVVGDAAGYVEPFTGEGMAWAIAGGAAVAAVASDAIKQWDPPQEAEWNAQHRQRIRQRQAGCRLVAATLRRPRLTRAVVRTLAAWPKLAAPLVQRITAPNHPPRNPPLSAASSVSEQSCPDARGTFV